MNYIIDFISELIILFINYNYNQLLYKKTRSNCNRNLIVIATKEDVRKKLIRTSNFFEKVFKNGMKYTDSCTAEFLQQSSFFDFNESELQEETVKGTNRWKILLGLL